MDLREAKEEVTEITVKQMVIGLELKEEEGVEGEVDEEDLIERVVVIEVVASTQEVVTILIEEKGTEENHKMQGLGKDKVQVKDLVEAFEQTPVDKVSVEEVVDMGIEVGVDLVIEEVVEVDLVIEEVVDSVDAKGVNRQHQRNDQSI